MGDREKKQQQQQPIIVDYQGCRLQSKSEYCDENSIFNRLQCERSTSGLNLESDCTFHLTN